MNQQLYLQALGLLTLAQHHYEKVRWCEKALAELLGVNPSGEYYGHLSDTVWQGETNLDELLRKLEINPPDEPV